MHMGSYNAVPMAGFINSVLSGQTVSVWIKVGCHAISYNTWKATVRLVLQSHNSYYIETEVCATFYTSLYVA